MNRKRICIAILFAIIISALPISTVDAARGVPGNPEFGYGISLSSKQGKDIDVYTTTFRVFTQEIKPDWLAIDLDWASLQPALNQPINLAEIDKLIEFAASNKYPVLLKLSRAPFWAQTAFGPEKEFTRQLVFDLVNRYPDVLKAIEIFPSANTLEGWGALPDAQAYTHLFNYLSQSLPQQTETPILLVAAGLRLVNKATRSQMDMDALEFMRGLYQSGIKDSMPVLSLQYESISGEALDPIGADRIPLRYYEEVRRVMLENDHAAGLIWITNLPASDTTANSIEWLESACHLLRAQLYIGAVFINIPVGASDSDFSNGALIFNLNQMDNLLKLIKKLIFQTRPETWQPTSSLQDADLIHGEEQIL
jgi:hypothetical protein